MEFNQTAIEDVAKIMKTEELTAYIAEFTEKLKGDSLGENARKFNQISLEIFHGERGRRLLDTDGRSVKD